MQSYSRINANRNSIKNSENEKTTKAQERQKRYSQRTIDTLNTEHQFNEEIYFRYQQQMKKQIQETLEIFQIASKQVAQNFEEPSIANIRIQEEIIQRKDKQLVELNMQIKLLKEATSKNKEGRPQMKKKQVKNHYYEQHFTVFSLADQIMKERKHLQLHMEHHRKIKQQGQFTHFKIKQILPQYYHFQKKRGLNPISYGQFKKKYMIAQKQKEAKEQLTYLARNKSRSSSRSSLNSSGRSSISRASVRDIIRGNVSIEKQKSQKSLASLQRKKLIIQRSKNIKFKAHENQIKNLIQTMQILRKEQNDLNSKISDLQSQMIEVQRKISQQQEVLMTFLKESK